MGCSSGRPVITIKEAKPSDAAADDDSTFEVLFGTQGCRRPSQSTTISSSTFDSRRSVARESTQSRVSTRSDSKTSLCSQVSSKPSELSPESTLWNLKNHPSLPRFEWLKREQLRGIQVEILSGMLAALTDNRHSVIGLTKIPCSPKFALMRCKRVIEEGSEDKDLFMLSATDLVVLSSVALVDAGVDRIKAEYITNHLGRSDPNFVPSSIAPKLCINDIVLSELVKSAETSFLSQSWNDFGHAVGQLAWHLVKDIPDTSMLQGGAP